MPLRSRNDVPEMIHGEAGKGTISTRADQERKNNRLEGSRAEVIGRLHPACSRMIKCSDAIQPLRSTMRGDPRARLS